MKRAEGWRWSSLGHKPVEDSPKIALAKWPVLRRSDWVSWVNQPQTAAEEAALRHCLNHSRPYGSEVWTARTEKLLGLGPFRQRGRPKKPPAV